MGLAPGTRLGPYEILAPIGAGGMGEVYRARDTKLEREVAIKVLPEAVAANSEALARFQREAKAVAALSHPNILAIHDLGEHEGHQYAVMELLEGETLRERLSGGPLPPRKAAELARQVARGLAAAHDKGIVHRDLKPENLFVTGEGRVKVLDFGLARTETAPRRSGDDATRTSVTTPGIVMGTVGYMSPEQAAGAVADTRSDIFALGAVLYEMLTGRRAFHRETGAETMTAILREDPPEITETSRDVPPALARVVRRCLEKRPEERFQSANDLGFAIVNAAETSVSSAPAPAAAPARRSVALRAAAVPLVLALGVLAGWALAASLRSRAPAEPVRIRTLTFSGRDSAPAISPDKKMLAFASDRDGVSRIWLKQLGGRGEAALTDGPDGLPQFSPDGASVYFVRGDGAPRSGYRVPTVGGQARRVLDDVLEVTPSPDGRSLAFLRSVDPVVVVGVADIATSESRELVRIGENRGVVGLQWSPDGRRLSLSEGTASGNIPDFSIDLIDVASGEIERVRLRHELPISGATWTPNGEALVFAQSTSLLGSIADPACRVVSHDPASGEERVLFWSNDLFSNLGWNYTRFALAGPGGLVFNQVTVAQNLREHALGSPALASPGVFTRGSSRDRQPAYSPDGSRVIFSSNRSGNLDLWTIDTATGAVLQITDDQANDWDPDFTADGRSILWSSDRGGNLEIWTADADGGRPRQVSGDGVDAENPTATPDGEWVIYASGNPDKLGIWKVRADGSEATHLVSGARMQPEVSPDGRWSAYVEPSIGSLRNNIRVVDNATGKVVPFSIVVRYKAATGNQVWGRLRWMPDARRIVFVGQNEEGLSGLYVQDFDPERDTTASRRPLAGFSRDYGAESFDVSPDGRRVVLSTMVELNTLLEATAVPGI